MYQMRKGQIRERSGKWLDTSVFRQEAIKFIETGSYCNAPMGSPDWLEYWEEQLNRCIIGYKVGNQKITGNHYMYLNFTQIQLVEKIPGSRVSKKVNRNPDFWDGDYEYFWAIEIAKEGLFGENSQVPYTKREKAEYWKYQNKIYELLDKEGSKGKLSDEYKELKESRDKISKTVLNRIGLKIKPHLDYLDGGYHLIIGKSRRKGYSYKNAAIAANIYNTIRDAQIIIGAFEKKFLYPKGTMGMTSDYLNFLNKYTGWTKSRDETDKQDHKKASYKIKVNGRTEIGGYKSEVFALTFKDNPDAARGKDGKIVLLEEAGAFPNLKAAYAAIQPALTSGSYITGQILIFGTGGDMEGGTIDYADMFYNPEVYGLMPFMNIWDEDAAGSTCGFFHPVTWNMEGYYDKQGNSDIEGATKFENARRKRILENSDSSLALERHVQEFPFSPSEAFLTVNTNNFPVRLLRAQLNRVLANKLQFKKGTPVELIYSKGKVTVKPDMNNRLKPIIHYKAKEADISGAPIIYEYPIKDPPRGLYKVGYDPYRQDLSSGVSLSAIYVYKSVLKGDHIKNVIVAEYVGRPDEADDVNMIVWMLALLYNTEVMHENEVTHVKNWFRRHKRLDRLAVQPDAVISKNIKNSSVARVYGMHMNVQLKDAGEKYIKDWLLGVADYDENGNAILNLEKIYSIGLLEELIQYNRTGNFDRVMALMQVMFYTQEEELSKEYGDNKKKEFIGKIISLFDRRK